MRSIRIGNGQGFWGDNVDAPVELLKGGPIDYIGMDYLAEVTLSIMMRQKLKDPRLGYATDFISFIRRVLRDAKEKNVRILTNAGGLNPKACRAKIFEVARELGVSGVRVGVVEGDDLFPRLRDLVEAGHPLKNMDTGEPIAPVLDHMMSANAYLGARPVVEALRQGAQIVLCGRITDTALTLAPMIHEFGWGEEDWDHLAAGTIAGHIIECGAQCTGGNFSRWWEVPDLWNAGYPIVEGREDGTFTVTKHTGTGGMVTVDTVSEQLLYEMGDPSGYITPDVVADFTSIRLHQEGPDRVGVSGIKGRSRARRSSRSPAPTSPATREAARSPSRVRARWRRRARRPRWCGSGWNARASRSRRSTGRRSWWAPASVCRACFPSPASRRRWCCASACAIPTPPRWNASARRSHR